LTFKIIIQLFPYFQQYSGPTNSSSVVGFVKLELDSFNEVQRVDAGAAGALWRSDVQLPVVSVTIRRQLRP